MPRPFSALKSHQTSASWCLSARGRPEEETQVPLIQLARPKLQKALLPLRSGAHRKKNVQPLVAALDIHQELTRVGVWKDSASVLPSAGISSHGSCVHRTQRIHCPEGGLFCTRNLDKGGGCFQLLGGGVEGVGNGLSLTLGHSYRVQLLFRSRVRGGQAITSSLACTQCWHSREPQGTFGCDLAILAVAPQRYS